MGNRLFWSLVPEKHRGISNVLPEEGAENALGLYEVLMKLHGDSDAYTIPDKLRQKNLSQATNYALIIIKTSVVKRFQSKYIYILRLKKPKKLLKWREGYCPKDGTPSLELVC